MEFIALIAYLIAGQYAKPKKGDQEEMWGIWAGLFPLNAAGSAVTRVVKDTASIAKDVARHLPPLPNPANYLPKPKPKPKPQPEAPAPPEPTTEELIDEAKERLNRKLALLHKLSDDEDERLVIAEHLRAAYLRECVELMG